MPYIPMSVYETWRSVSDQEGRKAESIAACMMPRETWTSRSTLPQAGGPIRRTAPARGLRRAIVPKPEGIPLRRTLSPQPDAKHPRAEARRTL
jgi:hypothetical protein